MEDKLQNNIDGKGGNNTKEQGLSNEIKDKGSNLLTELTDEDTKILVENVKNNAKNKYGVEIANEYIIEAIKYDNDMKKNNPGALYFILDISKEERISAEVASKMYYNKCKLIDDSTGAYEIYNLILDKTIPESIMKYYVGTDNGGSDELNLIDLVYGISKNRSMTSGEDMIKLALELDDYSHNEGIVSKYMDLLVNSRYEGVEFDNNLIELIDSYDKYGDLETYKEFREDGVL